MSKLTVNSPCPKCGYPIHAHEWGDHVGVPNVNRCNVVNAILEQSEAEAETLRVKNAELEARIVYLQDAAECAKMVLELIPAFGDSIGKKCSKAQIGAVLNKLNQALEYVPTEAAYAPYMEPPKTETPELSDYAKRMVEDAPKSSGLQGKK